MSSGNKRRSQMSRHRTRRATKENKGFVEPGEPCVRTEGCELYDGHEGPCATT